MKKILFVLALLFTFTVSAQEKKNLKGAMAHAKLNKIEQKQYLKLNNERKTKVKEIKESDLANAEKKTKIGEVKAVFAKNIVDTFGKEKAKALKEYWSKK